MRYSKELGHEHAVRIKLVVTNGPQISNPFLKYIDRAAANDSDDPVSKLNFFKPLALASVTM